MGDSPPKHSNSRAQYGEYHVTATTSGSTDTLDVLLIEDNADFAGNLQEILESEGASITRAGSVAEARDHLKRRQPDVAFVDLRLPDGSGEDLLVHLGEVYPDCLSIVLTGNATIQSAITAVEKGAFAFLLKDMPVEAVVAAFRKAKERHRLEKDRDRLERQLRHQEQLAMIGQMAATLAHEIRNPITGIRQALEVILEATGEPPGMEGIKKTMLDRLVRLHELVDDLLVFSRPIVVKRHPTSIRELVTMAWHEVRRDQPPQDVLFRIDIEEQVSTWPLDANSFRLVLRNLFENALLAVEGVPEPRIEVSARHAGSGKRFLLEIHDSGPGLAPDVATEIFKPFFTTRTRGTGLGLALTQRVIEEHNGTISAFNHPEGGAVFRIVLPES
ncbi:MAG TPA: response regulator [Planctomycetes bacterium]|nr:response regulator [Planctomycetota bacterium]